MAQVVLNRVRNPTYPKTICGVVYQNDSWFNRCQFSFACDGAMARVPGAAAWGRARRVAAAHLARGLVLLPGNRAKRAMADAFVRASEGGLLSTHPASTQRQAAVAATNAEIRRQQAAGLRPTPGQAESRLPF